MNKKKIILALSIGIVFIAAVGIVLYFVFGRSNNTSIYESDELKMAVSLYTDLSAQSETSVIALKQYELIKDLELDECTILASENDKIVNKGIDCDKANKYKNYPLFIILTSDGLDLNKWNNTSGEFEIHLFNEEKSYYKTEDITDIKMYVNDVEISYLNKANTPSVNTNSDVKFVVNIKNGEYVYEKKFKIMIDTDKPILVEKKLSREDKTAEYSDYSGISEIYYAYTLDKQVPKKDDMKSVVNIDLECGKTYYVWSYAKDLAGNESDIELVGSFVNACKQEEVDYEEE